MKMGRRDFLQTSLVAGAGTMLAGAVTGRAQQAKTDDLHVAMIGYGAEGQVLMEAMKNIPGLHFRAVCDIWENYNLKRGVGTLRAYNNKEAKGYVDYREMLEKEKDLDAVIVATPDFVHAEHTIASLKAGCHVYCEKMMAHEVGAAREMVRAMKATGKLLQIGHQRRSNPRYLFAYNYLLQKAKLAGKLTNANGQWNRNVRASEDLGWPEKYAIPEDVLKKFGYTNMREFRNWRWFKKYGGGPISDLGAHQIDIYNWFFGCSPKSVMADGGKGYFKDRDWYDNVMAIYEYELPEGSVHAFYQVLTTTSAGGGYYEQFMGTEGSIKISENEAITKTYLESYMDKTAWDKWVAQNYLRPVVAPPKPANPGKLDVRESPPPMAFDIPVTLDKPYHQPHLENFFDAVRGKGKLNCPADEAFHSEVAIYKVNEAVAAGKKLYFTPEDFAV